MKQPSVYLKMRVLGAVDTVAGRSFQNRRYEAPADLRGREIQLRHDRRRSDTTLSPTVIVYHKGQRIGLARLLDTIANGLLRRERRKEQS